ncbi:hypothetical protein [Microcoleus sp. A003_D6]|uniref:hypothetical protein n=1 Tax=Microcoleus sp. A003_D6 TaxID=3055266 RepID=UPI002FD45D05
MVDRAFFYASWQIGSIKPLLRVDLKALSSYTAAALERFGVNVFFLWELWRLGLWHSAVTAVEDFFIN